jgi:ribonuclease P protein component
MPSYRFPKKERLSRKKLWEAVFEKGVRLKAFPLALHVLQTPLPEQVPVQAGFAVPKRSVRKAFRRNRIRRLMREAYRLEKPAHFNIPERTFALVFLYLGKDTGDFDRISRAMKTLLTQFDAHEATFENKTDPAPAGPGGIPDGHGVQN